MKRLYSFVVFIITATAMQAQTYGNEWIDYSQKFLKLKVVYDGIYRIDSTSLANGINSVGGSLSSIDPHNFQVFHNGVEEYIWVEGESDNVFNNGDYLEFVGHRNDGKMDSALYTTGTFLNPYYSLFNDTAVYFLTWNSSITNRRFSNPNDTTFSSYIPSNYFTDRELLYGNSEYLPGIENSIGMSDPDYTPEEGFYTTTTYYGQVVNVPLNSRNAYAAGPLAKVSFKVGTHSNDWTIGNDNQIEITYPGSPPFDTIYDGFGVAQYNFTFSPALAGITTTNFTVNNINSFSSVSSGRTGIAWVKFEYPHTFDLEGRPFFEGYLPDNLSAPKSLLPLTNIGGSGAVRVYDLFNHHRIDAVNTSGTWSALVSNGNGSEKQFIVEAESNVYYVNSLTPVNSNGTFTDFSSTPVDSAYIIVTNKILWNAADQYRIYRAGTGGNHNVVLTDVAELYDQFAYGICGDPLSIRNFSNFLINTYPTIPKNLLLIGKSLSVNEQRYPSYYSQSLVPTFGYPPCDNNFTAGLNGTGWEPAIPTGRIAARDSAAVMWYLNKVQQYEINTPAEWMKYVLHFGGGTTAGEQQQFADNLEAYADTIRDTLFGGIVETYLKTSNAPIQINQSDTLRDRIESGVSIMTFFGHASGTGFDQSIDDPTSYNNNGKYPLLIANSCYAGNIHDIGISSSEAFTLLDQKGTIGYIASVDVGIPYHLNAYTGRLYQSIGKVNYGRSIGECMKWAVANTQQEVANDLLLKSTLKEMTFQGDPAVVINAFAKPDYEITNADVWFDQLTQPDSVFVFAKVTNLGRAIDTTYLVELKRKFPNGDTITYYQQVNAPIFRDTMRFSIPVDQQRGIGLNKISIRVDYTGLIPEMREDNNATLPEIDLLIHGSAIVPVYPYEFAVIPSDTVTLKACTANPLEPLKTYRFELDTTDLFNSPFKQTYVVNAPGGVVTWQPNLMSNDSMVYFWRVSPDSLSTADVFIWRQSSFQYIIGQIGWGQDHIYQFTNDIYQYVELDRVLRQFNFANDVKSISVKNGLYNYALPWNEVWYKINGSTEHIFSCVFSCGCGFGVTVAVIDPVTGLPWSYQSAQTMQPGGYFDCVPGTYPFGQVLNAFDFPDGDSLKQDKIARFIDSIPDGYHVLVYSQYIHSAQQYNQYLKNELDSIGGVQLYNGNVPDTSAFILWGVKGGTGTEVISPSQTSIITLNDAFTTNWNEGYVASPMIGPAAQWGSFHWKQHSFEANDDDSVYVELWGYNASGGGATLLDTFQEGNTDVLALNTIVDAAQYPYIKLYARMKDDTSHTPPQMDRWHVLYTPVPDVAIDPPVAFSFYNGTMQEGENAQLIVDVRNLTPWAFSDSMLYTYWIVDAQRNIHALPFKLKMPPMTGYASVVDTISFSTTGYPGANELWMEVNPAGKPNSQLEQYHFNNVLMVPFDVNTDRINPLLDVTFDGVHIMDGDIVSGKPQILVTLKDENQFLALNDTADFHVFLRAPSQTVSQQIYFSNASLLSFTPANLPNNSCKILFNPDCIQDGVYQLIVQAKDRSNNESGLVDYVITFEVINHPSVTNTMNYPNPFSTSTRFVFTLTGTEVPEIFTIQIMTITGKVVREINKDELGDIHIGRNITSYAWDGKDEYGDQLANGVYLYRVITRLNGDAIDQRESGADPYINHGWGKMYLMK